MSASVSTTCAPVAFAMRLKKNSSSSSSSEGM
jgi:hypothetical protein